MNKKEILKKAVGKGGPLVKAAQGLERGIGNIVSGAKEGYKKDGLVGGYVGAGKGIAKNIRSNFRGIGEAVKKGVSLGGAAGKVGRAIKNPPKPVNPPTTKPYDGPRGQLAPKATPDPKDVQKAPGKYMEPVPKKPYTFPKLKDSMPLRKQTPKGRNVDELKKIIKDRSQGGFQPTRPNRKRV